MEAALRLQATVRAQQERRDVTAIVACQQKTQATLATADDCAEKFRHTLNKEWRDTKMLKGVPVDLIAFEEALLKLQMELDNVSAGNVSETARASVRKMRRDAVKSIQQQLDNIDVCRQWWQTSGAEMNCHQMQPETLAVA